MRIGDRRLDALDILTFLFLAAVVLAMALTPTR